MSVVFQSRIGDYNSWRVRGGAHEGSGEPHEGSGEPHEWSGESDECCTSDKQWLYGPKRGQRLKEVNYDGYGWVP